MPVGGGVAWVRGVGHHRVLLRVLGLSHLVVGWLVGWLVLVYTALRWFVRYTPLILARREFACS